MKIVRPLILGFKNTALANQSLKDMGHKVKGPCSFLVKDGKEYDALRALAGFRTLTAVVALPEACSNIEAEAKSYIPRSLAGLFDGYS